MLVKDQSKYYGQCLHVLGAFDLLNPSTQKSFLLSARFWQSSCCSCDRLCRLVLSSQTCCILHAPSLTPSTDLRSKNPICHLRLAVRLVVLQGNVLFRIFQWLDAPEARKDGFASEPHLSNADKIKNAGQRPIQRLWTVPPRVGCFWSSQSKYSKVFFAVSTVLTKLLLFLRSTLQIGPFISNMLHSACTQLNPIDWLAIQDPICHLRLAVRLVVLQGNVLFRIFQWLDAPEARKDGFASEPHLSNADKIKNAGQRPIQRLWTVPPRVGCFWSSQSKYSKVFFAVSTVLTKLLLFLRSTLQIGPFISNNLHSACTQLNPIDWLAIHCGNPLYFSESFSGLMCQKHYWNSMLGFKGEMLFSRIEFMSGSGSVWLNIDRIFIGSLYTYSWRMLLATMLHPTGQMMAHHGNQIHQNLKLLVANYFSADVERLQVSGTSEWVLGLFLQKHAWSLRGLVVQSRGQPGQLPSQDFGLWLQWMNRDSEAMSTKLEIMEEWSGHRP